MHAARERVESQQQQHTAPTQPPNIHSFTSTTFYLTDRPEDLPDLPDRQRPKKTPLVEDPSFLQRPNLDVNLSHLLPSQSALQLTQYPKRSLSNMSNYSKYHHRINSDPARIHDWHVRHRSLSLAARMHANIQIPSSPTQPDMADRNTGFPEPLSPDRNTTLRHPDADTSPNACIEAHDIDLARTHMRRHSLLRERHASRHGKITVDTSYVSLPGSADGMSDSGYGSAVAVEKGMPVSFTPGSGELSESPSSSSPNSLRKTVRHSEDLALQKTRPSSDSIEIERAIGKRGLMGRIHSLRHRPQGSRG